MSQPQNTSTPMGPTTSAPKRPKIPEDISDKEKEEGEISNDKINEAELPVLNIQLKLAVEVQFYGKAHHIFIHSKHIR